MNVPSMVDYANREETRPIREMTIPITRVKTIPITKNVPLDVSGR